MGKRKDRPERGPVGPVYLSGSRAALPVFRIRQRRLRQDDDAWLDFPEYREFVGVRIVLDRRELDEERQRGGGIRQRGFDDVRHDPMAVADAHELTDLWGSESAFATGALLILGGHSKPAISRQLKTGHSR